MCIHLMQWQMSQVDKFCAKYNETKLALTLPTKSELFQRNNLFRHIIFDDKRKLIFCFVPKVHMYIIQGMRSLRSLIPFSL